mmetsp:Transcript_45110/g.88252  ORF Transcript_45110/g.88252 Transcript_45110/m.88252 type:complete len:329 (-) Transcript_45110:614-1600(-)
MTPACSDPSKVCAAGNVDVHRPSSPVSRAAAPFTYVVASDAQLDWFDGESPSLGRRNAPVPCDEGDSCGTCTRKFGRYTNARLAAAVQDAAIRSSAPVSFVMNGDLTAYFHPWERHDYTALLHDIPGIAAYYPGLGNHDIDHGGGAKYGGDQWVGPSTCNARHAMAYIKGSLCGDVPSFDPTRIVRYHAASGAYSWEEGRFHFVQVHYYPTYEAADAGIGGSLSWLERDLEAAAAAHRTSVLFVHSAGGLDLPRMEAILLGKNVAAIFSGHEHRCFMRKCVGVRVLREEEVRKAAEVDDNATDAEAAEQGAPASPVTWRRAGAASTTP